MNNTHSLSTEELERKLTLTDKFVGVLTEPIRFFEQLSEQKPKAITWLAPLIAMIIIASGTNYLIMSNPIIKDQAIEKQMAVIESALNNAVEAGQIPPQAVDSQLEQYRTRIEEQIESGTLINVAATFAVTFIMFFIVSGVLYLLVKFILKGEGNYSTLLSAYGQVYYILVLQVIAMLIYALATDKLITGTSLAFFAEMNTKEFVGYALSKLDPFSIWFYIVVSIGLAKMFKSEKMGKYFATVFGLWIGFSLLFFLAARQLPFLQMFIQ